MKSQVSIVRCSTYSQGELFLKVRQAVELIGGMKKFIKAGSRVLLKPNLLMAIEPEAAITTHPEFVRSVIRLLKEINCKICIGDGPSVFGGYIEDILKVYERTGIKQIADEEKIGLVTFEKRFMPACSAGRQAYFPLTTLVRECDYIVNLPKFKTHNFMLLTGAIKNLFGLIPGTFKLECHKNFFQQEKFAEVLLDIYQMVKPAISIVDGISGIEGNGPATSGIKRNFGLILAGADGLAIDVILAKLMDIPPEYVFTNKEAAKRNIGNVDESDIEIKGEKLSSCIIADFKLPDASFKQVLVNKFPGFIANILKKLITIQPKIDSDACRLCESCVKNCPQKTMSVQKGKLVIDYARCISCFCCQEACPYGAIATKKSFLARVLGI
ncbi:MAG: hypothetical protein A3G37_02785 [Omnitrophica WOR_2 bacterium RIFCSPLOWO2_12_FULL_46_30]|nr:MAG: hypothetical protein A3G37_02785 [Omnitrophica WOR_2 bacterium RIFCSPLOWO2_12_FULL_46_30]